MRDQAESNSTSGITFALYDTTLLSPGTSGIFNLFDEADSLDLARITKSFWGLFQVIKSTAKWKDFEITKLALSGTGLEDSEPIALYMADKEGYLSVVGKTSITGTCYLPKLGVRMAYIEGLSFIGEKLVTGETKTSKNDLPEVSNEVLKANEVYFSAILPISDSLVRMEEIMKSDSLFHSFNCSTLTLYSHNSITLDRIVLDGNIRVVSSKSIYVTAGARLDNIILYAPSIYFASGFSGSLQAFAQDTLITGEQCEFRYPSCLGIINENINSIYMSINRSTSVVGSLLLHQNNNAVHVPYLKLDKQTVVHGQIYCPGTVEIQGKVEGSVYCHGFGLNTGFAYYENYLMNTSINRLELSKYYAGSFLLHNFTHAKLIQWLN
jgi:hypothetical protein